MLVRTLTSGQTIIPFASLIYKKRLNASAISYKCEAIGPQASPAVANLRGHEPTKVGTAAVNGHMIKVSGIEVAGLQDFAA